MLAMGEVWDGRIHTSFLGSPSKMFYISFPYSFLSVQELGKQCTISNVMTLICSVAKMTCKKRLPPSINKRLSISPKRRTKLDRPISRNTTITTILGHHPRQHSLDHEKESSEAGNVMMRCSRSLLAIPVYIYSESASTLSLPSTYLPPHTVTSPRSYPRSLFCIVLEDVFELELARSTFYLPYSRIPRNSTSCTGKRSTTIKEDKPLL